MSVLSLPLQLVESVCCQVGIPDEIQSDVVSTAKRYGGNFLYYVM